MTKLKILMCSEASFLNSGFGNYTRELLTRLYNTNKYDIAELACYGQVNDPRDKDIPWKYYANAVAQQDPRHKEYTSSSENQFGRWRFDKVVLDFKPNVVIDIRDYWMNSYQELSGFRKFFNWVLMPTVDSAPQQNSWVSTFIGADAIFTYSDWGAEVLKNQSNNRINYIATASPGVNLDTYCVKENKELLKQNLGLPIDSFIIGSVMRNQKRKLIPNILYAFRMLLDSLKNNNHPLKDKTYLYLHTSYPDAGWDIPELLKETRLLNKVYFTYKCSHCSFVRSHTFSHPLKICARCLNKSAKLSSVVSGVTDDQMSDIYNIMDLYVQYSICEGFGMPQVEAAACGVPVATVNYSAMKDIVTKLEAYPIKIRHMFKELETKALRANPDDADLAHYIEKHMNLSPKKRAEKQKRVRMLTEKHYNWDHIAKVWENFLDSPALFKAKRSWDEDPIFQDKITNPKMTKNNLQSLYNICHYELKGLIDISDNLMMDMCKNISYGFINNGPGSINPYNIQHSINQLNTLVDINNNSEKARSMNYRSEEDFIRYANIKNNTKI